jgi:hypothetical protein
MQKSETAPILDKTLPGLEQPSLLDVGESRAPCPSCGRPYGECIYTYMSCYLPVDNRPPRGAEYLARLGIGQATT